MVDLNDLIKAEPISPEEAAIRDCKAVFKKHRKALRKAVRDALCVIKDQPHDS